MIEVLNTIGQLENYNLDAVTIQNCFKDPEKNIDRINGYATRIMLIHLRATEKAWHLNLDELIGETCLYACELAKKYIERKLYQHKPGKTKRGFKEDTYVNFQCYMQVMRMRIGLVEKRYLESNPTSRLNRERIEFYDSELKGDDEDMTNDLMDVIDCE